MVTLEMPDLSVGTTVESLYQLIQSHLKPASDFEMVAYGRILKRDKHLAHYGIKSNSLVYLYRKRGGASEPKPEASGSVVKVDTKEIQDMVFALKAALANPNFKSVLDKLNEKDFRDKLLSGTPGLKDDPMALSILQDAELLTLYAEPDNIRKVLDKHPSLMIAATKLAAHWHEEHPKEAPTRRHMSYLLDDPSDDEDDDDSPSSSQESASRRQDRVNSYRRFLQDAVTNAQRNLAVRPPTANFGQGPQSSSFPVVPPTSSQSGLISHQMLQQAIQSANQGVRPTVTPVPATRRDWREQLQQMREVMPTLDTARCIQALEATDGDVDMALDIVLNQ